MLYYFVLFVCSVSWLFLLGCQYQCKWLTGKTRLRNDLMGTLNHITHLVFLLQSYFTTFCSKYIVCALQTLTSVSTVMAAASRTVWTRTDPTRVHVMLDSRLLPMENDVTVSVRTQYHHVFIRSRLPFLPPLVFFDEEVVENRTQRELSLDRLAVSVNRFIWLVNTSY